MLSFINQGISWRKFLAIQFGFALYGFSIAIAIRSNLGASSWAVLEVALSRIFPITPGTSAVLIGSIALLIALSLRQHVGWGTVVNMLSIGPWEDLFLWLLPELQSHLLLQLIFLLTGVVAMSLGTAIYIRVDAGAGPRDSLMLAVARTTPLDVKTARILIETAVVLVGWALGGPLGAGTILFALLIGPGVHYAFRLFNIETYARRGFD